MANQGETPKTPRATRRRRPAAAGTGRTKSAPRSETVTEASEESFPASDPPAYTATTTGGPDHEASSRGRRAGTTPARSRGGRSRKKNESAAIDPFAPAPDLGGEAAASPSGLEAAKPVHGVQQSWDNVAGPSPSAAPRTVPILLAATVLVVLIAAILAIAA